MIQRLVLLLMVFVWRVSGSIVTDDINVETREVSVDIVYGTMRTIQAQTLEYVCPYSEEEIYLIALVALAEAEGECELGQRLVIDTILNRIDSSHFPDTVEEVIYQSNQFTSMWDGRCTRVTVTDDICNLVCEEIMSRENSEAIYFSAGQYSIYGKPMFPIGNHYFSSYE